MSKQHEAKSLTHRSRQLYPLAVDRDLEGQWLSIYWYQTWSDAMALNWWALVYTSQPFDQASELARKTAKANAKHRKALLAERTS